MPRAAVVGLAVFIGRRVGGEVEQLAEELCAGDTVDGAVVDLGDEGEVAVLEALDDVHLPEGLLAVQRPAADVADELAELLQAARRRKGGAAKVEVDVEGRVVDPVGVAEAERDLDEAPPEYGDLDQAAGDQLADSFEREPALDGRRVEDGGHGNVHMKGRGLQVEEAGVEPAQAFHGGSPTGRWWS